MANNILVEPEGAVGQEGDSPPSKSDRLVSWVMYRLNKWRDYRDTSFKPKWDEYYRLWRGRWAETDRNRKSERSKIVTPALAQAIDMTVAELQMAVFSNHQWFDVSDDYSDEQVEDIRVARDHLLEDLDFVNAPDAIVESFQNGALFGTLFAKIVMFDDRITEFKRDEISGDLVPVKTGRVFFGIEPLPPDEVIVDPSGRTVEEMLGIAHEVLKPRSAVQKLQNDGTYRRVMLGAYNPDEDKGIARADLEQSVRGEDVVLITEYHGLVPARLLPTKEEQRGVKNTLDELLNREFDSDEEDGPLVEAIVTIANKTTLLRAIPNPFPGEDRSIVACPLEKVPGRFYGRGVAEKGYNPQKALDAEMRMRIDAMALVSNPMMGADATRLPRGFDFTVRPGKVWLTQGSPRDVLHPVEFSNIKPETFNQTSELERMVQMGTGAFEVAAPLKDNRRNETAAGSSMIQGAFVKRAKLMLHNIERNYLIPLLRKLMWRYMQFQPDRYPADARFKIASSMGIMARELEQAQIIQLMSLMEPGTPPFMALLKSVVENASITNKREVMAAIDSMLNPSPEQQQKQQQMEQIQMMMLQLELAEKESKARVQLADEVLKKAQAMLAMAKAESEAFKREIDYAKLEKEFEQLHIDLREVMAFEEQVQVSREKVDVERIKAQKQGSKKE